MDLRERLQQTLGESFTLEQELGGGGMSRVFVALDESLGRRVVVKTIEPELAGSVSNERFRREIRLAASLQQANIVPVLSAGEVDGLPFYSMPFVEGRSLRQHLATRGALGAQEAAGILRDIARALRHAHERGVVHRDIKPENVLLSGSTAVVTDFGIAKAIEASQTKGSTLTHIGTVLGTPAYISPEQVVGDSTIDHRADIYSLGVVGYEMLAGVTPFTQTTARGLMAAHLSSPPPPLPTRDTPAELAFLIMRCLEKDPVRRPQSVAELLEVLEPVSSGSAIQPRSHPSDTRRSVAVLPFSNIGGDQENEYFSEGVTDDLIAQIARIKGIKVMSRNATTRYRNTSLSLASIASELRVDTLISGSVRRAGNRVRIVVELIDPRADEHLWTETYDRELQDVFAVQTDVARNIASALAANLTISDSGTRKTPTRDMQAYELYLLGRHHWNKRNDASVRRSIAYFEQAIARDPDFAAAHSGLADAYIMAALGYATIPLHQAFQSARDAASKALSLDDALPEAHVTMGLIHGFTTWDNATSSMQAFDRAIALNQNHASAHQFKAWFLSARGEYETALRSWHRAMALDPMNVSLITESGWPYCYSQLWELGLKRFERALELDPEYGLAHYNVGLMYHGMRRYPEAVTAYERALRAIGETSPIGLAWLGAALAESGDQRRSESILRGLESRSDGGEYGLRLYIALVYDALGDVTSALDSLDRAYQEREPFLTTLSASGWLRFTNTRNHPRFQELLNRLNLPVHDIHRQQKLLIAATRELAVQ